MAGLKKYGFLIVNGVILLVTLILYFASVSGRRSELEKVEKKLERDRKALVTLASRKPTQRWYDIVESNIEQVKGGLQSIENGPKLADKSIHRFFDLNNPAKVTEEAPARNAYSVFKEMMVKKWDNLIGAFSGEEGPYGLPSKVLTSLEPKWLRSQVPPTHESQVVTAMKSYWLTTEILEILAEKKVEQLQVLGISDLLRTSSYKFSEKEFWGYRKIEIEGRIDLQGVEELFQVFSGPDKLYRVTGFSFENVSAPPLGVYTNATFLRFRDAKPQRFKLSLMHFDYLSEGESFEGAAMPTEKVTDQRRRRRRR